MGERGPFLNQPVEPFEIERGLTGADILSRMERISFQGRNLAVAHRVWHRMLADDVLIFLGTAGALSAGGLRLILAHLVAARYVDCLVTTGANLYHDLHETLGRQHYLGSPDEDDGSLQAAGIDRVYDTYAREDEFIENDHWIAAFTLSLERRPYSTREYIYRLGEHLWTHTGRHGLLTAAYRANVPVFCPAIADSSLGMGISQARHEAADAGQVDVTSDIIESTNIVLHHPRTASVVIGGGTPKNFINQASVQAASYDPGIEGHQFAIQIVADVAHFGGASGASLDEAKSWGKLATDASRVTVRADATIALPLLASALVDTAGERLPARRLVTFDPSGRTLLIDGRSASHRYGVTP